MANNFEPPLGYQLINESAISWLFENHHDVYKGFYEHIIPAAEQKSVEDKCPVCAGDGYVTNALDGKEVCPACKTP